LLHQHVQHDVLRHPNGEVGIDDSQDRYIRQMRISDDMIDTRSERKDHLEMQKAREQAMRRMPGASISDLAGLADSLRPHPDVAPRGKSPETLLPGFRIEPRDGEQDRAHQRVTALVRTISLSRPR
jgi:hypothetical protein